MEDIEFFDIINAEETKHTISSAGKYENTLALATTILAACAESELSVGFNIERERELEKLVVLKEI